MIFEIFNVTQILKKIIPILDSLISENVLTQSYQEKEKINHDILKIFNDNKEHQVFVNLMRRNSPFKSFT